MMKFLIPLLAVLHVSACANFELKESSLIHPNNSGVISNSLPESYHYDEIQFSRNDGSLAFGVSVINPKNTTTVMYFGGNQFDVSSQGKKIIDALLETNVNVIMFDHRGYGKSTGEPTVSLLLNDALKNYDYVRS